ncbi:hypothetical protein L1765_11355 [Microaerobacter geothermalis]|uniref:hypothetical protein n=1 Tax=Microaerobacter geothermalis TaxID=674972 RepID=UPI001F465E23|nr:hypothetical protein [Microaerobacter geothermalis]MCF6094560.1 hypothetical protein [Microaerobacter geothermalis]
MLVNHIIEELEKVYNAEYVKYQNGDFHIWLVDNKGQSQWKIVNYHSAIKQLGM